MSVASARIVAHDFGIEGWEPDKTVQLPDPENRLKPDFATAPTTVDFGALRVFT